jgi:hypothetical protein
MTADSMDDALEDVFCGLSILMVEGFDLSLVNVRDAGSCCIGKWFWGSGTSGGGFPAILASSWAITCP